MIITSIGYWYTELNGKKKAKLSVTKQRLYINPQRIELIERTRQNEI